MLRSLILFSYYCICISLTNYYIPYNSRMKLSVSTIRTTSTRLITSIATKKRVRTQRVTNYMKMSNNELEDNLLFMANLWHTAVQPNQNINLPVDKNFDVKKLCEYLNKCMQLSDSSSMKFSVVNDQILINNKELYNKLPELFPHPFISTNTEDIVLDETINWVQAMIADFAICPFTNNAKKAGIPRGDVRYTVSSATTIEEAFRDYWCECFAMFSSTEKEVSTILLVFSDKNLFGTRENFEMFSEVLDLSLRSDVEFMESKFTGYIDNVYFHPEYKFLDKDEQVVVIFDENDEILGTSDQVPQPIDYARRSPYPVINILRSQMVKGVQKAIPEGRVFNMNKDRLETIGLKKLQNMMNTRNWGELSRKKVDKTKLDLEPVEESKEYSEEEIVLEIKTNQDIAQDELLNVELDIEDVDDFWLSLDEEVEKFLQQQ